MSSEPENDGQPIDLTLFEMAMDCVERQGKQITELQSENAKLSGSLTQLLAAHLSLMKGTLRRALTEDEKQARFNMLALSALPVTEQATDTLFLGLNLYAWALLPPPLAELFGLQDAVRRWTDEVMAVVDGTAGFLETCRASETRH